MSRAKPWPKCASEIQRSKACSPLPEHLQRQEQKTFSQTQKLGPWPLGMTAWHMKRGLEKMEVKGQVSSELMPSRILTPLHQEPGLLQTTAQYCKHMGRPQRKVPGHHLPVLSPALFVPVLSTIRPVHFLSSPSLALFIHYPVSHLLCLSLSFLEEEAAH